MKENQHNMLQGSPQSNGSNLIDEIREIIEKGRKEAYFSSESGYHCDVLEYRAAYCGRGAIRKCTG